jgi:hypothetical protein
VKKTVSLAVTAMRDDSGAVKVSSVSAAISHLSWKQNVRWKP